MSTPRTFAHTGGPEVLRLVVRVVVPFLVELLQVRRILVGRRHPCHARQVKSRQAASRKSKASWRSTFPKWHHATGPALDGRPKPTDAAGSRLVQVNGRNDHNPHNRSQTSRRFPAAAALREKRPRRVSGGRADRG